MFISESFKRDTISHNTDVVPIVLLEIQEKASIGMEPGQGIQFQSNIYRNIYGFSTVPLNLIEPAPVAGNAEPPVHCKPLLLSMPKLKESIDMNKGKYKISSLTISLSNAEYMGERISKIFNENNIINTPVSVHLHSPSCRTILPSVRNVSTSLRSQDCARIYVGRVKSVKYSDEKIDLSIEDISQDKTSTELPLFNLGSDENVPDKYRNAPIPITYGRMKNAPTVAKYDGGELKFMVDHRTIYDISEDYFFYESDLGAGVESYTGWINGAIKTYDQQYVSLLKEVQKVYVTNKYLDDTEGILNPDYANFDNNMVQYRITDDNKVAVRLGGLWGVDRIQGIASGKPSKISFVRTGDKNESTDNYEFVNQDKFNAITDGNLDNFAVIEDETIKSEFTPIIDQNERGYVVFPYSLRYDTTTCSSKFHTLVQTKINGFRMPVPQDHHLPEGYGHWGGGQFGFQSGPLNNRPHLLLCPSNFRDLILISINQPEFNEKTGLTDWYEGTGWSGLSYGGPGIEDQDVYTFDMPETYSDVVSLITMSANHGNDEGNPQGTFNTDRLNAQPQDTQLNWNENAFIKFKTRFNDDTDLSDDSDNALMDGIPILRFHKGQYSYSDLKASDKDYCLDFNAVGVTDHLGYGAGIVNNNFFDFIIRLEINDINSDTLVELEKAVEKDYFLDVRGRVSHANWSDTDFLENPIDIMRDLIISDLNFNSLKIDEDEYEEAKQEHLAWKFAFSVTDRIKARSLLEKISQSTFSFPRIKNNGNFGFVTVKKAYGEEDYNLATEIHKESIIKFNFSLSPYSEVISSLNMEYGYDYGSKSYLKSVKPDGLNSTLDFTSMAWNKIRFTTDHQKNIQSKFINDLDTATDFRNRYFHEKRVQHLLFDIDLPLSYSSLEVGDKIKISKLVDGIKPFGIDYTNPHLFGNALRYPLFIITSVKRSIDRISIECRQLHWLEMTNANDLLNIDDFWSQTNFAVNYFANELGTLIFSSDPAYAIFDADDWEYYSNFNNLVPFVPVPIPEFLIGANSQFWVYNDIDGNEIPGGEYFGSSYIRNFIINDAENFGTNPVENATDEGSGFLWLNEKDRVMGINNFPQLGGSWMNMVFSLNDQGGYGSIMPGNERDRIGGFVAMELRMSKGNGDKFIYALQNVAGTIYDSDIYEPTETDPQGIQQLTPSTTELKLGWVLYQSNSDWEYYRLNNWWSNSVWANSYEWFTPVYDPSGQPYPSDSLITWELILFPYYNPNTSLMLEYMSDLSIYASAGDDLFTGNANEEFDILDVVILANLVIHGMYASDLDFNSDGILDVLDIIALVDLIMGNDDNEFGEENINIGISNE